MSIDKLTEAQYGGLLAVVDGHTPSNAPQLEREGLLEPITQANVQDAFQYRLSAEGRRHYTAYRERVSTSTAHLQ